MLNKPTVYPVALNYVIFLYMNNISHLLLQMEKQ